MSMRRNGKSPQFPECGKSEEPRSLDGMKETGAPALLYRYRPFGFTGDERELATFRKSCLYFPSRSQFNDPLDCTPPSISISRAELDAFIDRRTEEEFKELTLEQRRAWATELKQSSMDDIHRFGIQVAEHLGILSLATRRDNFLMWSHYTNSHRGFCLEFDASMKPFCSAHQVIYTSRRQAFNFSCDPAASRANAENFVLTKHADWKYEGEWRVIVPKGCKSYPFPPDALTGVIFGCSISDADRNRVMSSIRLGRCRPAIYQARGNEEEFGLEIEPVS